MKTLYLIRHAEALYPAAGQHDADRPLSQRGLNQAEQMARHLTGRSPLPGMIMSSPAVRTMHTARIFQAMLLPGSDVLIEPSLYLADATVMLGCIANLPDDMDAVAIFGHNPGISSLVSLLGSADAPAMAPCAIAGLEAHLDYWSLASCTQFLLRYYAEPDDG